MVTTLNIQLERNELRALRANAARQLRSPQNLARFMILKQMGFIPEEQSIPTNASSDVIRQDSTVAAPQAF